MAKMTQCENKIPRDEFRDPSPLFEVSGDSEARKQEDQEANGEKCITPDIPDEKGSKKETKLSGNIEAQGKPTVCNFKWETVPIKPPTRDSNSEKKIQNEEEKKPPIPKHPSGCLSESSRVSTPPNPLPFPPRNNSDSKLAEACDEGISLGKVLEKFASYFKLDEAGFLEAIKGKVDDEFVTGVTSLLVSSYRTLRTILEKEGLVQPRPEARAPRIDTSITRLICWHCGQEITYPTGLTPRQVFCPECGFAQAPG